MWSTLVSLVFPRRCLQCGVFATHPFCRPPVGIPYHPYLCPACAAAIDNLLLSPGAGRDATAAIEVFSGFRYAAGLAAVIQSWKYGRRPEYAPLVRRLVQRVLPPLASTLAAVDLVTSVPLSRADCRRRGFNQAAVIAAAVASRLDKKLVGGLLVKIRQTVKQAGLAREERQRNLSGAFRVTSAFPLAGKTVLVCDDVLTTGATLGVVAARLQAAGAVKVKGFTLARTPVRNAAAGTAAGEAARAGQQEDGCR